MQQRTRAAAAAVRPFATRTTGDSTSRCFAVGLFEQDEEPRLHVAAEPLDLMGTWLERGRGLLTGRTLRELRRRGTLYDPLGAARSGPYAVGRREARRDTGETSRQRQAERRGGGSGGRGNRGERSAEHEHRRPRHVDPAGVVGRATTAEAATERAGTNDANGSSRSGRGRVRWRSCTCGRRLARRTGRARWRTRRGAGLADARRGPAVRQRAPSTPALLRVAAAFAGAALTAGFVFGALRGGAASGFGSGTTTGDDSGGGTGSSASAPGATIAQARASRDNIVASRVRARRDGVIEAASMSRSPLGVPQVEPPLREPAAEGNSLFGQDSTSRECRGRDSNPHAPSGDTRF